MELGEILKYIIPSLLVLLASYLSIYLFLKNETKKKQLEISASTKEITLPIRLQAYERIVLFLERISPNSLLIRVSQPGMSAFQLQAALITNIREEFEHNLSQQLYISSIAWEAVKNAKEEIVKIINTSAIKLTENEQASGDDLNRKIFEMIMQMEKLPTYIAIERVKSEIRGIY